MSKKTFTPQHTPSPFFSVLGNWSEWVRTQK